MEVKRRLATVSLQGRVHTLAYVQMSPQEGPFDGYIINDRLNGSRIW